MKELAAAPAESRPGWYFYRLREDDFISEFCIARFTDPETQVATLAPDGSEQVWRRRQEFDILVFTPPDAYAGSQPLMVRTRQVLEAAPREQLELYALANRCSVHFPPSGG